MYDQNKTSEKKIRSKRYAAMRLHAAGVTGPSQRVFLLTYGVREEVDYWDAVPAKMSLYGRQAQ